LFEDAYVENPCKLLTVPDQMNAFSHKLRIRQFLKNVAVLDEVAHITETNKCLFDYNLVVLEFLMFVARVLRWVIPFELQLIYCLSYNLL